MKHTLVIAAFLFSFSSFADMYVCEGPKDTVLKKFRLNKLSLTEFDPELDGTTDGLPEKKGDILEYIFNNGCDNDARFRIHKSIVEYQPEIFNMRADYFGPDEMFHDTEIICRKTYK